MKWSVVFILACAFALAAGGCSDTRSPTLEESIQVFLENDLDTAGPMLARVAGREGNNPDAHAWHAECLRRQGDFDRAYKEANAALAIDPDHSFAHTVLGDLYSPRLGSWGQVDADSAWAHLLQAVRADPGDGNAWSSVWIHSMRRGDKEMEHRAAAAMIESSFLTPSLLAYNRWQLEHLPPNAMLITNGDMDTYPSVALQEMEGLREDVAVINVSLLNLPWYVRNRSRKYGIPLPYTDDELDRLRHYKNIDGEIVNESRQIIAGWLEMQKRGELDRPLCAAITLSRFDFTEDAIGRRIFCGSYYEFMPRSAPEIADIDRVERSLSTIRVDDLEGPFASTTDRSPVRRSSTDRVAQNITASMLRYVEILARKGMLDEARSVLEDAEYFDSRIRAGGAFEAKFETLREAVGTTI
jgi:tetratricopeptide (TPR) repeat protein